MKYFWDSIVAAWSSGWLSGKPACVFTSTASAHDGQESTVLTMQPLLLHHGMLLVDLPYQETALSTTRVSGKPCGVSHLAGSEGDRRCTKKNANWPSHKDGDWPKSL